MIMLSKYPTTDPTSILQSLRQADSFLATISTHVIANAELHIEEKKRIKLRADISNKALRIAELHSKITEQDSVFSHDIDSIRQLIKEQKDDIDLYQTDDALKSLFIDYSTIYTKISSKFDVLHIKLTEQFALENASITDVRITNMGTTAKAAYDKVKKSKKYQYYLSGALLGCAAIALTILCPPAGAAVSVGMWAAFVAGAADSIATIGISARDITNSVGEDFINSETKAKLEDLIQEQKGEASALMTIQQIKNNDSITKQHNEILKDLQDKTKKTISEISSDIKGTIEQCKNNGTLSEEEQARMLITLNESEILLDIEKEIETLNSDLISLLDQTQDKSKTSKSPKDIPQQFNSIIKKLEEAKGKINSLEIPHQQKSRIQSGIRDNIEHTRELHQGLQKYAAISMESKKIAKAALLKKIATCKRSRLISGFAIAIAVTSIALVIAFPPAGALAVVATGALFCSQLTLGGAALSMSVYDAHKSCKELSEHKDSLAKIEADPIINMDSINVGLLNNHNGEVNDSSIATPLLSLRDHNNEERNPNAIATITPSPNPKTNTRIINNDNGKHNNEPTTTATKTPSTKCKTNPRI